MFFNVDYLACGGFLFLLKNSRPPVISNASALLAFSEAPWVKDPGGLPCPLLLSIATFADTLPHPSTCTFSQCVEKLQEWTTSLLLGDGGAPCILSKCL